MSDTKVQIEETIKSNSVVLYMKGTKEMPQCGFSSRIAGVLNYMDVDYKDINVLADDAIRQGFDDTIASHPNIKVVAEGEGQYLGPDGGIKATQDILQITDSFDVMVGADQSIQGAAIVLADEGMAGKVKLIGLGGSEPAIEGVADGSWFGGVYGAPADEGRIAMEAMVQALADGTHVGGVDPLTEVPDDGLITASNVEKFTAQWKG